MKNLLFITVNKNNEENINPDYTYTDEDMLKRYLEQRTIKRKFWRDDLTSIKYSVVNGDCSFIINEVRLRHNFKTYESFKRNIDNYKYIQKKEQYEKRLSRYEKKKETIKDLVEIIQDKEQDIKDLEDNKLNIDTIIEEKIKHKLNNIVSNQSKINSIRDNILRTTVNNSTSSNFVSNPYSNPNPYYNLFK